MPLVKFLMVLDTSLKDAFPSAPTFLSLVECEAQFAKMLIGLAKCKEAHLPPSIAAFVPISNWRWHESSIFAFVLLSHFISISFSRFLGGEEIHGANRSRLSKIGQIARFLFLDEGEPTSVPWEPQRHHCQILRSKFCLKPMIYIYFPLINYPSIRPFWSSLVQRYRWL